MPTIPSRINAELAHETPLVAVSFCRARAQASTPSNIYANVMKTAEEKGTQTFDKANSIIIPGADTPKVPALSAQIKKVE